MRTKCINVDNVMAGCADSDESPTCGARPKQGPGRDRILGPGVVRTFFPMGNVHKSVEGSLNPCKITLPSKIMSHFLSSNVTLQPVLHRGQMPMSDATVNDGTMCPNKTVGKLGISMSQT